MDLSQALILVGSDGKLERHSQSRTEFVLLARKPDALYSEKAITAKLLGKEFPIHYELGLDGLIEVKQLHDKLPLFYVYIDTHVFDYDTLLRV